MDIVMRCMCDKYKYIPKQSIYKDMDIVMRS